MNIHELWKMVHAGKPRLHATGFAQLYLADGVRLHVWSDKLFKHAPYVAQNGFFHDHRYRIKSQVLRGALLDQGATFTHAEEEEWGLWEVRPAHEGEPEKPHLKDVYGVVSLWRPRIIRAGACYSIAKRAFHQTRALEPTVTIMRKMDEEETWARLLVPNYRTGPMQTEFDPMHSLIKQPTQDEIKIMMWDQCKNLGEAQLARIEEMIGEAYRAH